MRTYTGYAVQTLIKSKLGADGSLLANVLPTKTGFAFCPTKGNSTALKNKLIEGNFFSNAIIEQASPWISYRISIVPRKYGAIEDNLQHCLMPVTRDAIHAAVAAAAGSLPISVTPSRDNEAEPNSSETAWVVRFSDNKIRLPRTLFLFGCRTITRLLPRRTSKAQCTRCWLWHNTRICSSSPRYRLCGSSQYLESNHTNLCAAQEGHICPPKCIHCHGAHPADDPKCLLRPHPSSVPKTRSQTTAIRKICSEARLKIQAKAGCVKILPANTTLDNEDNNKTTLHPPRKDLTGNKKLISTKTTSTESTINKNLFTVLETIENPSNVNMEY